MAKRKREVADGAHPAKVLKSGKDAVASAPKRTVRTQSPARRSKEPALDRQAAAGADTKAAAGQGADTTTIQIITGSYERVLHGFTASIPGAFITGQDDAAAEEDRPKVNFSDTFMFNAHTSAIRCLALTPPTEESSKVVLATGGTDERINLFTLSTAPPPPPSKSKPQLPSLLGTPVSENSKNKELGALLHHSSTITALYFPSRSKLLSSSEDSTIAVTRTRDWTPLSIIKAPIPKAQGRPSGDTAAPGEVPAGVNDFAVHPSMKLMVSVGKGEKCMRLWNLVTGKKAGVLTFSKNILASIGEGRFGSGEGRKVVWDTEGEEFAVAFERGVVVFGIDCKPKAKILPTPRTKIHQMHYLSSKAQPGTLLVSTEDGRIMLYDTNSTTEPAASADKVDDIPQSNLVAAIGGPAAGFSGRVKDFEILQPSESTFLVVSGSSDGTVRLWSLAADELKPSVEEDMDKGFTAKQIGRLLGTYTTGTRITCLKAFVMTGKPEAEDEEDDVPVDKGEDGASSSSEDDSE